MPQAPNTATDGDSLHAYISLPDMEDHPRCPLRLVRGNTKSNGSYKLHYITPDLIAIGCSKLADPNNYTPIETGWDYNNIDFAETKECWHCAKHTHEYHSNG